MRTLVEPFRRHQFGAGAHRGGLALELDLRTHEYLHRGVDRHRAESERPGKGDLPFEKRYVAHGETKRHGYFPLSQPSRRAAPALRLAHASLPGSVGFFRPEINPLDKYCPAGLLRRTTYRSRPGERRGL